MKRLSVSLILVLLLVNITAIANPVDLNKAKNIGAKFLNTNTKITVRGSSDLELGKTYNTENGTAAFYVFNAPNGYVIVSADDCAHPILGYSDESQFNNEDVPINMQEYLEGFVEQIAYGVENQVVDPNIARQWQLVQASGRFNENRIATVVEPLLTDTWRQTNLEAGYLTYNYYCPFDEEVGRGTLVGCVALSMGQIMHYWGYPAYGKGSMTYKTFYPEQSVNFSETLYDWANMPDALNQDSDFNQINAVATLLWHCGVSVQIEYGVTGTAGDSSKVGVALVNNFYYSPDLYGVFKYNYTNEEWFNMVKSCLDLNRPIHYSGGQHAFVCDGYDANDYFHFNWGWGGMYDGYFQLDALNPGGSGNYHIGSYAIFNIHPNCSSESNYDINVTANLTEGGSITGSGTYYCGDACSLVATPAEGYSFCSWTDGEELVSTEPVYNFTVVDNRNLMANFVEDQGNMCNIVFNLYDSYSDNYGDGWNGNYLTVNYSDGCFSSEQLTIDGGCAMKYTRKVVDGSHIVLGWISGESTSDCYFSIRYENGPVICEGYNLSNDYTFEFDVDCDGSSPKYYTISTCSNPSDGGMVSGDGTYLEGSECTVTATADDGFTFVNWTCIGEVMSTDPTYSFAVTQDIDLVANFVSLSANITNGALSGAFSVSDNLQVNFSQGNLQYIGAAETPYWKFAEHQWDYLGDIGNNNFGRDSYKANRDLFGWGTSGYDHGALGYEPWRMIDYYIWYQAYGNYSYNLYDMTGQADWGFNAISNGGNAEGKWRTLTDEEWRYLLFNRTNAVNKIGKATVNGYHGVVLLPDEWNLPDECSFMPGTGAGYMGWNANIYSDSEWALMEANGAVFLPAAGQRNGTAVSNVDLYGYYWSASTNNSIQAFKYYAYFRDDGIYITDAYCNLGFNVRLVHATQEHSFSINSSPNPENGGCITGMGTYTKDQYCILTANANDGFTFVSWMENGVTVSTDPKYSFKVTENRHLNANFVSNVNNAGVLSGTFSVSDSQIVHFSQGNLQYKASYNTWRFAEHQWDYVGGTWYGLSYGTVYEDDIKCDNTKISPNYSGWIDLFGYGTSGYDHGAVCYQPWSTSMNSSDYYAYGNVASNLYDQTGRADWGYNAISNGGNVINTWRTLTMEEWSYVFVTRKTSSGIRFAKAKVNNVNGVVLLPDDWDKDYYNFVKPNILYGYDSNYDNNIIDLTTWTNVFESHGAVFLPAADSRFGTFYPNNNDGYYWSSSTDNEIAVYLFFDDDRILPNNLYDNRFTGNSVRLVRSPQNYCCVAATNNILGGGTVNGNGVYFVGAECSLSANANAGYVFSNWTENGEVVSTTSTYSFTVTDNRIITANFTPSEGCYINVTSNSLEYGVVSGRGTYVEGTECTLIATPKDGYVFTNWTEDDNVVSDIATYSFIVTGNRNLVANFSIKQYNINVNNNPSNGGVVTGSGMHVHDVECTLTATANPGYVFVNWMENGEVVSTDAVYTFPVTGDRSLFANFISDISNMGVLNGAFSVNANRKIHFSKGNLQYIGSASTPYWKFADHQWDRLGLTTGQNSENQNVDRDLFGWGTSGYNHGAVCYQPWSTSESDSDYYAYGSNTCNLYDQTGQADWGYNAINNGGNSINIWRTLTKEEWEYLLKNRQTISGIRCAKAQVNGINGIVILPDDWNSEYYTFNNPNVFNGSSYSFTDNQITVSTWTDVLEAHGAVFLPATSLRYGLTCYHLSDGYYWTSSNNDDETSWCLYFYQYQGFAMYNNANGMAVRLVSSVYAVTATPNHVEYGTVSGGGTYYMPNTECTLTATANAGYVFTNWTENGVAVSSDNPYIFTVDSDRNLVANFAEIITVTQSSTLVQGWNWYSTYIEQDGTTGMLQLKNTLGNSGVQIKSQTSTTQHLPNGSWLGTLTTLENEKSYRVNVSAPATAVLQGTPVNPEEHPITLQPNWTWIGYPVSTTQSIAAATTGFTPRSGDVIKSQGSSSIYTGTMWFPSLNLEPGQGYLYKSTAAENRTLTFVQSREEEPQEETYQKYWTNDIHAFADNMTMIAVITENGEELYSSNYELGAFVNGENRGSVRVEYCEPLDKYVAVLTINGEDGERVTFGLVNRATENDNFSCSKTITFTTNAVLGTLRNLETIEFSSDNKTVVLTLFPNPVDKDTEFTIDIPTNEKISEVIITNTLGEMVMRDACKSNVIRGISQSGVYNIQIITERGNNYHGRLIVK